GEGCEMSGKGGLRSPAAAGRRHAIPTRVNRVDISTRRRDQHLIEVSRIFQFEEMQAHTQGPPCVLPGEPFAPLAGVAGKSQYRDLRNRRSRILEQGKPLSDEFGCEKGDSGDIAARTRETVDEPCPDRVAAESEYYRDGG